jgi:hypothetical protein
MKKILVENKEIIIKSFYFALIVFIVAIILNIAFYANIMVMGMGMMLFPIQTNFEIISLIITTVLYTIVKNEKIFIKNILLIAFFVCLINILTFVVPSIYRFILIHKSDTIRFVLFDGSPFVPWLTSVSFSLATVGFVCAAGIVSMINFITLKLIKFIRMRKSL